MSSIKKHEAQFELLDTYEIYDYIAEMLNSEVSVSAEDIAGIYSSVMNRDATALAFFSQDEFGCFNVHQIAILFVGLKLLAEMLGLDDSVAEIINPKNELN